MPAQANRISARDARDHVENNDAYLVCSYEDESKCEKVKLDGAMTRSELNSQLGSIPKEAELIFYCQ